jgi:tRNA splicing endonuclease
MLYKLRVKQQKLPYGRYKYAVVLSTSRLQTVSVKYDLFNSKGKLQLKNDKTKKRSYLIEPVLDLDELEETLERMCIGKFRLSFEYIKNKPIKIYLTDKEDLFVFFMHYESDIFKIYEFKPKTA